jgi:TolB-like protein
MAIMLRIMSASLVLWSLNAQATVAEEKYVRLWISTNSQVVGEQLNDESMPKEFRVFDLKTQAERVVPAAGLLKVESHLTDDQVVQFVGIAPLLAYRIKKRAEGANNSGQITGKIAQVTPTAVYVNIGTNHGIRADQALGVFRPGVEIKDPDTGKVLARERPKVAELEVFEVGESLSKARIRGNLEILLKAGDEVDAAVPRLQIAVLPLTDEAGVETVSGSSLREEIVTSLVKQGLPVVERSQLDKVASEGSLQRSSWFDPAQAQEFGKLLGATIVVTGKVVASDSTVVAHLRLVNTATAEILTAVSGKLKESDLAAAGAKAISTTKMEDLMKQARTGSSSQRRAAIQALADTKHPTAAKFLADEMLQKEPFTTPDALQGMGPVAADVLQRTIEFGDFSTRIKAMRVFTKVATKKHIPFLKTLLSDIHLKNDADRTIRRLEAE